MLSRPESIVTKMLSKHSNMQRFRSSKNELECYKIGSKSGIIPISKPKYAKKKRISRITDSNNSEIKQKSINNRAQVLNLQSRFERLKGMKKFQSVEHKQMFRSSMGTGSKYLLFKYRYSRSKEAVFEPKSNSNKRIQY